MPGRRANDVSTGDRHGFSTTRARGLTDDVRRSTAITVRAGTWSLKGRGWVWRCEEHVRARGYHAYWTRTDWYLRHAGKPPREHPWRRALRGALEHHHRYHVTDHECCLRRQVALTDEEPAGAGP